MSPGELVLTGVGIIVIFVGVVVPIMFALRMSPWVARFSTQRYKKMRRLYDRLGTMMVWRLIQALFVLVAGFLSVRYLSNYPEVSFSWAIAKVAFACILTYLLIRRLALYVLVGSLRKSAKRR